MYSTSTIFLLIVAAWDQATAQDSVLSFLDRTVSDGLLDRAISASAFPGGVRPDGARPSQSLDNATLGKMGRFRSFYGGSDAPNSVLPPDEHAYAGTLYTADQITRKVKELGQQIDAWASTLEKPLVVVCILKGGYVFCADLMRAMKAPVASVEFVRAQSYVGTQSTGKCEITIQLPSEVDLSNSATLVVEDLIETGLTLSHVKKYLESKGATDLKICCLIDKPFGRLDVAPEADFVGFRMTENHFVLGFGTDYNQRYRNTKDIVIADKKEVLKTPPAYYQPD